MLSAIETLIWIRQSGQSPAHSGARLFSTWMMQWPVWSRLESSTTAAHDYFYPSSDRTCDYMVPTTDPRIAMLSARNTCFPYVAMIIPYIDKKQTHDV